VLNPFLDQLVNQDEEIILDGEIVVWNKAK
jgi:hypothetical protein